LNNDGTLVGLIYPRCDALWEAAEKLECSTKYQEETVGFTNPFQFHTLPSFKALLAAAGFSEVNIWQKTRTSQFPNASSFKDYIQGWLPHCGHFKDSFIDDWFENYVTLTNQESKRVIEMTYDTIYFSAQ